MGEEFVNPFYQKLRLTQFQAVEIVTRGDTGLPIPFQGGAVQEASIIVESGSFYMTLASNASMREFPDSTASAFKVQLPEPVCFGLAEWEVALTKFIYPETIRQKRNMYKFQVYIPGERLQMVELSDQRFYAVGDFLKGVASMVAKWFTSKGISNGNRFIDIRDEDDYTRIEISGGARLGFHRNEARLVWFLTKDDTIDPNYRHRNHRVVQKTGWLVFGK